MTAEGFGAHPAQEGFLGRLNELLSRAEPPVDGPSRLPVLLVVGAPRSGTTLLTQWLAASGKFAVPTNLVARFPGAPQIAHMLQTLLTDPAYDYRGELGTSAKVDEPWASDVGKTSGLLAPHEYSWFWRRFLPLEQAAPLPVGSTVDWDGLAKGFRAFEIATGQPFAGKGILVQYALRELVAAIPNVVVLHTVRDPLRNAASLLRARQRVTGDQDTWFSVEPPGTKWLRTQSPAIQVAGQVICTNYAIEAASASLPGTIIRINHGLFCLDPGSIWERLRDACSALGYNPGPLPDGRTFEESMSLTLSDSDVAELTGALRVVESKVDALMSFGAEQRSR